nr:unnamed protein product [Digitaria exilis]
MWEAMTGWPVGMSAGEAAALKPVPSGLSTKRRPKRRFHEKGLREREAPSGLTKKGPSSKKTATAMKTITTIRSGGAIAE